MEKISGFYPNQRAVKTNRTMVTKNSGLPFVCLYRHSWEDAACNLKASTFKVWLWFASNKPNYITEFSPAYLSKAIKVAPNTAKAAFTELKDKGYIVECEENSHRYEFYEAPQRRAKINLRQQKREFIDNESGEIFNLSYAELLDAVGNEAEARQLWSEANVSSEE